MGVGWVWLLLVGLGLFDIRMSILLHYVVVGLVCFVCCFVCVVCCFAFVVCCWIDLFAGCGGVWVWFSGGGVWVGLVLLCGY